MSSGGGPSLQPEWLRFQAEDDLLNRSDSLHHRLGNGNNNSSHRSTYSPSKSYGRPPLNRSTSSPSGLQSPPTSPKSGSHKNSKPPPLRRNVSLLNNFDRNFPALGPTSPESCSPSPSSASQSPNSSPSSQTSVWSSPPVPTDTYVAPPSAVAHARSKSDEKERAKSLVPSVQPYSNKHSRTHHHGAVTTTTNLTTGATTTTVVSRATKKRPTHPYPFQRAVSDTNILAHDDGTPPSPTAPAPSYVPPRLLKTRSANAISLSGVVRPPSKPPSSSTTPSNSPPVSRRQRSPPPSPGSSPRVLRKTPSANCLSDRPYVSLMPPRYSGWKDDSAARDALAGDDTPVSGISQSLARLTAEEEERFLHVMGWHSEEVDEAPLTAEEIAEAKTHLKGERSKDAAAALKLDSGTIRKWQDKKFHQPASSCLLPCVISSDGETDDSDEEQW